ncbi:MAG: hypothetical protein M3443_08020 [Actinomycetota bacterium]|nr:hypothetical protein [Actinomycetota bacterium]
MGKHLRARGIETKPVALTDDDVKEAARLYIEGWTLAQIADKYEVGNNTVRTHPLKSPSSTRELVIGIRAAS